jgi:pimeloyl-ACP methyl ester carboxylesterase
MPAVTSRDGTSIAYETRGSGPPLILVDGAFCHRGMGPMPDLARHLERHFTVILYDRRGRGASGNGAPWAIAREVEDLAALVEASGESAALFGISSGAVLALDAAASGLPVSKVAVYEPPLIVDATREPVPDEIVPSMKRLLAEGNRAEMVKRFMRLVGAPGFVIAIMRLMPNWKKLLEVAHTLPYDLSLLHGLQSGRGLPEGRWAGVAAPCLVIDGGKSPQWMRNGAEALSALLARSTYKTLPGQTHMVKSKVLAPALIEFLGTR